MGDDTDRALPFLRMALVSLTVVRKSAVRHEISMIFCALRQHDKLYADVLITLRQVSAAKSVFGQKHAE